MNDKHPGANPMNPREENTKVFSPFWPLCLLALSLAGFLGWQVTAAAQQRSALLRLADQQALLSEQAAQAAGKLQAMMMDLLELSRTDADAQSIVDKYGIKFNPAPAAAPPVLPAPPAVDAVLPALGTSRSRPTRPAPGKDRGSTTSSGTWTDDIAPQK